MASPLDAENPLSASWFLPERARCRLTQPLSKSSPERPCFGLFVIVITEKPVSGRYFCKKIDQ